MTGYAILWYDAGLVTNTKIDVTMVAPSHAVFILTAYLTYEELDLEVIY
jgi:hypothetical protein